MSWSPEQLLADAAAVVQARAEVEVDVERARALAQGAPDALLEPPGWDEPGMYDGPQARVAGWLLAYNAINFCYWPDEGEPPWSVEIDGQIHGREDEALGVMVAFAHALRHDLPLDEGPFLASLTLTRLASLLAPAEGAGPLPLLQARHAALQELGRALVDSGGVPGLLGRAQGSAVRLVEVLVEACPRFEDTRRLGRRALPFRKRAQLFVAMLHARLRGQGLGAFHDIDRLTVFADYRLPQVLRGEGVLRLSESLASRIDRGHELTAGEPAEVALRAATVHAAEVLRQALEDRRPGVNALVVDHLLWRTAVLRHHELPPFHRTRTIDY